MRRRREGLLAGHPVLVGAVTVLVTIVAVTLAYNANEGLPFVPVRELEIELPNGAAVVAGNEVRIGGERIGAVDELRAAPIADGRIGAVVLVSIDRKHGDIPIDSTVVVRPRSPLGLKFLEIDIGRSERTFGDGDRIPVGQTRVPVDLDEFWAIYDKDTREGARGNLRGFGDALAGRGYSLNRTIEEAPRFLRHLQPVMEVLGARETNLRRFFAEVGDFVRVVRPIAERYAHGFQAGADTFEAWSRHPESLRATLQRAAPTMRTSIRSFRVQRPFLVEMQGFSRELRGVAEQMPRTLPRLIPALDEGTPILRRTPTMNRDLGRALGALRDLMQDPGTGRGLRGLGDTVGTLNPILRFIGPYVTVCNYLNYSLNNLGEHLTEPDPTGGAQRTLSNSAGRQKNSVASIGATAPANGEEHQSGTKQFWRGSVWLAAINDAGDADCEGGQRGWLERNARLWPEKYKIHTDPRNPGLQGPTWTGRPRVPEGQTFSSRPEIGPRLPDELHYLP